jgi:hypothetical protein
VTEISLVQIGKQIPESAELCWHLDAGMVLQPGSERRRTRIRKHLKWAIGAEVDQDGFEI